jgi:serine/threonine-protein phosphatase 2A regulatory subunit B'
MDRYESWKKIRARAVENANGHLPEGFMEDEPQPPPPMSPDDGDIVDLAMDLNAVSIDGEVPHDLDDSGIERVPTADPGIRREWVISRIPVRANGCEQRPLPDVGTSLEPSSPLGSGTHVRRRSVIPGK